LGEGSEETGITGLFDTVDLPIIANAPLRGLVSTKPGKSKRIFASYIFQLNLLYT